MRMLQLQYVADIKLHVRGKAALTGYCLSADQLERQQRTTAILSAELLCCSEAQIGEILLINVQ